MSLYKKYKAYLNRKNAEPDPIKSIDHTEEVIKTEIPSITDEYLARVKQSMSEISFQIDEYKFGSPSSVKLSGSLKQLKSDITALIIRLDTNWE